MKGLQPIKFLLKVMKILVPWLFLLVFLHFWQTQDMLDDGASIDAKALHLPNLPGSPSAEATPRRLVYFFAPWCGVCHANIDNLTRISKWTNSQKVSIVLVALDWEKQDEVSQFMAKHQMTLPVLLGTEETGKSFGVRAYPSYYILDESQRVVAKSVGYSPTLGMLLRLWLF